MAQVIDINRYNSLIERIESIHGKSFNTRGKADVSFRKALC